MSAYFVLKAVHVVSAAVLFGTGLGIAFFKWITDRSGNAAAIRIVSEKVVVADWLFTLPAILLQALTGFALARLMGYPLLHGWLAWSIALFCLAGLCWIPVVWLQIRMRDLARMSEREGAVASARYRSYARLWFWLGVPAFTAVLLVFWIMVAKPTL
ncbi:MAG TPA: DUF2269 domain-containing protein [Steroidobacteraceae bacterium]|nr:DUF2269 domain-containing protein [Steroidobacteraceae bacterium]